MIESISQEEQWAKKMEDKIQDSEKRMTERAEQAFRQNGHFLQSIDDAQGIMGQPNAEGADAAADGNKKKGQAKEKGGCTVF